MIRVLVTHPYLLDHDPHERELGKPYTPITTLIAAAIVREAGIACEFFDAMFCRELAEFESVVDQVRPTHIAVLADDLSVSIKMCLSTVRADTQAMAQIGAKRGIPVLVGGPDVSDHPALFVDGNLISAAVGDATEILVPWLLGESGIAGLHGTGGLGGRRTTMQSLDHLPEPARDLIDVQAYADTWRRSHGFWELNVSTSRGCPFRCNWCAKPTWGRTLAVRRADLVADEVRRAMSMWGPDRIWFTDDIFALQPSWLQEYREALQGDRFPYRALCRVDLLEQPSYADDLAATGCEEVWVGAESGSDRVLAAMDKGVTVEQITRAVQAAHQRGIRVGLFLQLGYPGETLVDVSRTIAMVERLSPDEIGVSVSYPLPGTLFYEHVAESLGETHWKGSMENRPLFGATYTDGFYGVAKEVLRSTHSSGRLGIVGRRFLRDPGPRTARRLLGGIGHSVRLPWMKRKLMRAANPNPEAVVLTW